jgi:ketosteroid isomerase-like protein
MTTSSPTTTQILACEKKLLDAFRDKDLLVLDELIHDQALFVLPNALTINKSQLLENYRTGHTSMAALTTSDQLIHFIEDTAIISFQMEMKGTYHEQEISALFRYMRVWKWINNNWKVISTCGVPVTK